MSKDAINQYDATAANNTDVGGISIDEGMLPSNVNNALREIMSHLKDVDAGTSSLTSPVISGDLTVDTSTLKVDSSNNRVGVNITSPIGDGIHVKVPDGGTGLVLSGTTTSTGTEARLTAVNEAGSNWHNLNIGANNTIFRAAGTEKARITTDGLTFNGDTAAANALDDYEEGTWTPGITGMTYEFAGGVYTKIGRRVQCSGFLINCTSGTASSDHAKLSGLPFQVANNLSTTALEDGGVITFFNNLGRSSSFISVSPDDSSTECFLYFTVGASTGYTSVLRTDVDASNFSVRFSFTYISI